ncbi:MAG: type II toxin-antitoxin system prevent-host-death family antitoxin [Gammaproteobacteria bacterium]|nr:type II toxin-antitoxin system prevent-host-death family antitoxin [Gammaproteobacteria bacterium]
MEIGIYEAKTHLASLIARAEKGERITITRHGRPVAVLTSPKADDMEKHCKAVDALFELREELRRSGVKITRDEIIAWKNEGRR